MFEGTLQQEHLFSSATGIDQDCRDRRRRTTCGAPIESHNNKFYIIFKMEYLNGFEMAYRWDPYILTLPEGNYTGSNSPLLVGPLSVDLTTVSRRVCQVLVGASFGPRYLRFHDHRYRDIIHSSGWRMAQAAVHWAETSFAGRMPGRRAVRTRTDSRAVALQSRSFARAHAHAHCEYTLNSHWPRV